MEFNFVDNVKVELTFCILVLLFDDNLSIVVVLAREINEIGVLYFEIFARSQSMDEFVSSIFVNEDFSLMIT